MTKPKQGKPQTEAQRLAVLEMEREVVRRYGINGESFYSIEKTLGITHADRIYKRAMSQRPMQERDEAARTHAMRYEALYAQAWRATVDNGLEGLAERIAAILCDNEDADPGSDVIPDRVRRVIESAYADTLRGVQASAGVLEKAVKLHGTDHGSRVADAQLQINAAQVQVWGSLLVQALDVLDTDADGKRRVLERMRELSAAEVPE